MGKFFIRLFLRFVVLAQIDVFSTQLILRIEIYNYKINLY